MPHKLEVKLVDFHGEAYYTVFIDGEEMTSQVVNEYGYPVLPVASRGDALEIGQDLLDEMEDEPLDDNMKSESMQEAKKSRAYRLSDLKRVGKASRSEPDPRYVAAVNKADAAVERAYARATFPEALNKADAAYDAAYARAERNWKRRHESAVVTPTMSTSTRNVPAFVSLDEELPDPVSTLAEANSDGSISDGEREQADELINSITDDVRSKIRKAAIKLHRLGGPFRAPGYLQRLMQGVNQAVTDAVKDEVQDVKKDGGKAGKKVAKEIADEDKGEKRGGKKDDESEDSED